MKRNSSSQLYSSNHNLSSDEIKRYSRHLVLSDVGVKGQSALKDSSVLVIGAGGLGSPCLLYLAAAGVGHIGIVVSRHYTFGFLQHIWLRLWSVAVTDKNTHFMFFFFFHKIWSHFYFFKHFFFLEKRMRMLSRRVICNVKSFMEVVQ